MGLTPRASWLFSGVGRWVCPLPYLGLPVPEGQEAPHLPRVRHSHPSPHPCWKPLAWLLVTHHKGQGAPQNLLHPPSFPWNPST